MARHVADHVTKMASNVTWSGGNDTGLQCNASWCGSDDGGSGGVPGVDDRRIIGLVSLPIYLAAFVFGLVGNTLVIYVIARCLCRRHSLTQAVATSSM